MLIDLTGDSDSEKPSVKRPRLDPQPAAQPVEDDSDVELAEAAPAPVQTETAELGEDEDLVVTGDVGDVALRDYPHSRCDCVTKQFSKTATVDNQNSCAQCYCYVCDCKVSGCQFWGTGESVNHHCNAYNLPIWNRIKSAKRAGDDPAVRLAFTGAGSNAPSRSIPPNPAPPSVTYLQRANAAMLHLGPRGMPAASQLPYTARRQDTPPAAPPAPCAAQGPWVPLPLPPAPATPPAFSAGPDPALDSNLIELGTITYRCQATNGVPIAQLAARFAPHGFAGGPAPTRGEHIWLGNILASEGADSAFLTRDCGRYLTLLPPAEEVTKQEPNPIRLRKVLLVTYAIPAVRARHIGVKVNRAAPLPALRAAILAALNPPLQPNEALIIAQKDMSDWTILDPEAPAAGTEPVGHKPLAAFRVPAAPAARFRAGAKLRAEDAAYALVQHVWEYETAYDSDDESDDSYGGFGGGCACGNCGGGYDSEDEEEMMFGGYGGGFRRRRAMFGWGGRSHREPKCLSENYGRTSSWASTPLLIPLDPLDGIGGPAAAQKLTALLTAQLEPYRKAPAANASETKPGTASGFALNRKWTGINSYTQLDFKNRSRGAAENPVPERHRQMGAGWPAEGYVQDGVVRLHAKWVDLADPRVWDSEALEKAEDDAETVTAEDLEENTALDRQLNEFLSSTSAFRDRANRVLRLLLEATKLYPGKTAAASLSLSCPDPSYPSVGSLQLTVYAARQPRNGYLTVFTGWESIALGEAKLLPIVEEIVKQGGGEAAGAMKEQLAEVQKVDALQGQSVNRLISSLVTGELPEAEQPEGLSVQMRGYQKQSLHFLLEAERREGGFRDLFWVPVTNSKGDRWWYSPVWQQLCLDVPVQPTGGFLAEEMGLGKTIEVLALILANPAPATWVPGTLTEAGKVRSSATLVVCAVSLVGQWVDEVRNKLAAPLRIYQYHGSRTKDKMRLATEYDIVVTTYSTMASDFKAGGNSDPLSGIDWHRIVFDEGHTVKNPAVGHSKAAIALTSQRRWCCTGTPISSSVEDLLGQFMAIHMRPLSNKTAFDNVIKPAFTGRFSERGGVLLRYTLKQSLVRHVKDQVLGGEQVLQLPPKTEENVPVTLTAEERALYLRTHAAVAAQWAQIKRWSPNLINQRLLQIMALLLPLRRICSGGALLPDEITIPEHLPGFAPPKTPAPKTPGAPADATSPAPPLGAECSICLDSLDAPHRTPCGHWFCRECIQGALSNTPKCPLCRTTVSIPQLIQGNATPSALPLAITPAGPSTSAAPPATPAPPPIRCEAKLRVLLQELAALRDTNPTAKVLIFSQYSSTLTWLQGRLPEEGFAFRTITGSMPMKKRAAAIEAFQKDLPTTVFLLSVRSGAVGINLTAASHVFLLEPCINPALEEQAIGRAWRMGQQHPVTVKRLYVQGSIEESIMNVVKTRRATGNTAAAAFSPPPMVGKKRPIASATAIAGAIRGDRQALKVQELETLFSSPKLPQPVVAPPVTPAGGLVTGSAGIASMIAAASGRPPAS